MKSMKNIVRMIAALLVAVMMLSTAAFAEEWTGEACEPAEEMMAAETASEEETFEVTDWDDVEAADIAEAVDMAVADEEAEGAGSEDEALIAEDEEIVVENEEADEETAESESEDGEAAEDNADDSGMDMGMDLLAAFDESDMPEIKEEAEEVDRTEMMATLIDETIAANQGEGIYGALDATFEALAENAMALSNPENGVIEVKGEEIIDMTVNALHDNFGGSTEKLMGAVGAAAVRADASGYIQALGGDHALVCLAASSSKAEKEVNNAMKVGLNGVIDHFIKFHPALTFLSAPLKDIVAKILSLDTGDPYASINGRLDEINAKLTTMEQGLKNHIDNVVLTESFGGIYDNMVDKANDLNTEIQNILGRGSLSEGEKKQMVCDLEYTYYKDLKNAMTEASKCLKTGSFRSQSGKSVFDVAYDCGVEGSLFSGEALDMATPYMLRVLCGYLKAYAAMNQWLNIYEEVYGTDSQSATRAEMSLNLGGVDIRQYGDDDGQALVDDIEKAGSSGVFALYRNFFDTDRYVYVGYGTSTKIYLKKELLYANLMYASCEKIKGNWFTDENSKVARLPLSPDQVKTIAKHCANMKVCLVDYLLNIVGFELSANGQLMPRDEDGIISADYFESTVIPTGRQVAKEYMNGYSGQYVITINLMPSNKVGAQSQEFTLLKNDVAYGELFSTILFQAA